MMKNICLVLLCFGAVSCGFQQPKPFDAGAKSKSRELVDEGVKLLYEGDFSGAEARFLLATEMSDGPEPLDGLGCVYFLAERFGLARKTFRSVIDNYPEYARAYANLAMLEGALGNSELAEQLHRKALELEPTDFRTRNNFASFLHDAERGSLTEVRFELEKAKAIAGHKIIEANLTRLEEVDHVK